MANVIHKTTLQYYESVNEPLFPEPTWKWSPDMSQVAGVPQRYWKWDVPTDRPVPMTSGEQATIDAAILTAARDSSAAMLDNMEEVLRAVLLTILDEFNAHATKINQVLSAIDAGSNLTQVKSNIAAVTDYPQRTVEQLRSTVRNKLGT